MVHASFQMLSPISVRKLHMYDMISVCQSVLSHYDISHRMIRIASPPASLSLRLVAAIWILTPHLERCLCYGDNFNQSSTSHFSKEAYLVILIVDMYMRRKVPKHNTKQKIHSDSESLSEITHTSCKCKCSALWRRHTCVLFTEVFSLRQ